MSQGTKFIRSVLESGQWKHIRRVKPDFFTEEEYELYEFVRDYHRDYGELPSVDIVNGEEGFHLPGIGNRVNPSYWHNALRQRYAHRKIREGWPQLIECMGMGSENDGMNQNRFDIQGAIATLRSMLSDASFAVEGNQCLTMSDTIEVVRERIQFARMNPGLIGITTGWGTLDRATQGLMGGDLIVIAGRPSMGKSYLLMEMAQAAHATGLRIGLTSMEMGLEQITIRWIGRKTGINPTKIRTGELDTYEWARVSQAMDQLEEDDRIHLLAGNMEKSVAAIESMILEHAPEIIFVDSAYLLSPSGQRNGYISKWEAITEVIRELKQLALRYDIPVVITVQFNRNVKNNSRQSLDMGDIAGSDAIPQDASIVLGARKGPAHAAETQRIIDMMKNREGACDTFAVNFGFSPVNMEEVPLLDNVDDDGEDPEELTGWMLIEQDEEDGTEDTN